MSGMQQGPVDSGGGYAVPQDRCDRGKIWRGDVMREKSPNR